MDWTKWTNWINWGDAPTWVGTAVAITAAIFASLEYRRAKAAARDATEALATVIRPIFAFGAAANESIGLHVTGEHPAVDVSVVVTGPGGVVLGEGKAQRIAGKVPHTVLSDVDDLVIPLHALTVPTKLGESLTLSITARASDVKGLRWWEQRGRIRWEVRQRNPNSEPEIFPVEFDQGEPVPYAPAEPSRPD